MAPSTASCFTLIGVGLIAHLLKAALGWIPRVVASVVLAVACTKLVEMFGDLNFGIEPWFVRNPGLFGAVPTGRMAPMTAINFLFIGTGLLALTGRQPQNSPVLSVHSPLLSARLFLLAIGTERHCFMAATLSGRAFHCLRFFSIGNRHRDGGRRDGMAVASIAGRLHSRAVAACFCAAHYRSGSNQWLDQREITCTHPCQPRGHVRPLRCCLRRFDRVDHFADFPCGRRANRSR